MPATFWHIVLTDSWGWVCQLSGRDLEKIFGVGESLQSGLRRGGAGDLMVGEGMGWGGCWRDLLCDRLSTRTTDGGGMPCAASGRRNPSQLSNGARACKNSRASPLQLTAGLWNEE